MAIAWCPKEFKIESKHGISRITPLTPNEWVGPTHNLAITLIMPVQRDTSIEPHF